MDTPVKAKPKMKLYGFNNLTKTLSFNIYDICYTRTEEEKKQYIQYIDEVYNAERLTNILTEVSHIIGANILNIAKQDYDPQGASVTILISEEEIEKEETIKIEILSDEEIAVSDSNDFQVRLETTKKITTQNIYKTLSKYALGVIDRTQIENFKNTIEWINGIRNIDNLPKIAILTSDYLFSTHPQLMVYLRKTKDNKLPYAVAEFRFACLTFVYIIPNSNKDTTDFTQDNNFEYFWNFFKHYSSIQDWSFQKMNDNTIRPFVMNLNIGKNK